MGSIKGTKIELATAADLTRSLQEANNMYDNGLKEARDINNTFKTALGRYNEVVKEADALIVKAKEIGADAVVKDATDTKNIANKYVKECTSAISKLSTI